MHRRCNSPPSGHKSLHSACTEYVSCAEAAVEHIASETAHTDAAIAHMEDVTSHVASATAHTVSVTIKPPFERTATAHGKMTKRFFLGKCNFVQLNLQTMCDLFSQKKILTSLKILRNLKMAKMFIFSVKFL